LTTFGFGGQTKSIQEKSQYDSFARQSKKIANSGTESMFSIQMPNTREHILCKYFTTESGNKLLGQPIFTFWKIAAIFWAILSFKTVNPSEPGHFTE
jgi:hypothetical protein